MSLQKHLEYNKGLFMYRVLSSEAPEYISNLYTHIPSCYSNSRNYQLSLPRPRIDIFKTRISFSGAYLWNNLPLRVRSCQSLSSFKCSCTPWSRLHRMDCDVILLGRERETDWGFWVIAIAMTGHLGPILYTHRTPLSPSDCVWECPIPPPHPFLSLPHCSL